jgi:hypothetical protein
MTAMSSTSTLTHTVCAAHRRVSRRSNAVFCASPERVVSSSGTDAAPSACVLTRRGAALAAATAVTALLSPAVLSRAFGPSVLLYPLSLAL